MPNRSNGFQVRLIATALAVLSLAVIGAAAGSSKATPAPSATADVGRTTGFVGDETCATCHDTQATAIRLTLHGKAQNPRTPAASSGQTCETCHGAGQKHVDSGKKEDIKRFTTVSAHHASATVEIVKTLPKTDVKFGYDYTKGQSSLYYTTAPNFVQPAPVQLPAVTNERNMGTVDALYHFTGHIGLGLTYLYEKYSVDDFALGSQANGLVPSPATVATPSIMMLGYYWQPYKANTFCGRLSYRW